jgi:hypothetical protein
MPQAAQKPLFLSLPYPSGSPRERRWIPVGNALLTTCFSLLGNQFGAQQINLQSELLPAPAPPWVLTQCWVWDDCGLASAFHLLSVTEGGRGWSCEQ